MPLTHVCVWDCKNGYRQITIEEASKKYPYRVSASQGIFICSLCGQNVGLTAAGSNVRHFRHTSAAQRKECEDRAQAYARASIGYDSHPMPLRIKVNHDGYLLELGLFYPSSFNIGGSRSQRIRIMGENSQEFVYAFERISSEGITYLNVGNIPSSIYRLDYDPPSPSLSRYWPTTTSGINPKGSFFECFSGKMLHTGGNAYPSQDYYLLQRQSLSFVPNGISYELLTETRTCSSMAWYLYKIHIHEFSAEVACFFLKRSIFLTEKPVSFYPIWPPYIEDPYFLYHNDPIIYFYMEGRDVELNTYPVTMSPQFVDLGEGKLYKIYNNSKEQLLSLGQSGSIGFSYLMKKKLNRTAALPQILIKSIDGKLMEQNIWNRLPKGNQFILQAPFDGKLIILRNDHIQEIRHIIAEQLLTIDGFSFGYEIQIFQGNDLVRTIVFEKTQQNADYSEQDQKLVKRLCNCKGTIIPVSHSIGVLVKQLSYLPLSRNWLYQAIRQGKIPTDAVKILTFYQKTKKQDRK